MSDADRSLVQRAAGVAVDAFEWIRDALASGEARRAVLADLGLEVDEAPRFGFPDAKLDSIEILVLDEADRMLDMGFLPAMKRILAKLPRDRQTMLFSATFESQLKQLALEFMREPKQVQVAAQNTIAETIVHRAHPVDVARKRISLTMKLGEAPASRAGEGRNRFEQAGRGQRMAAQPQAPTAMAGAFAKLQGLRK